nr:interferon lambda receptor 1 isoform X2 [Meriones unguiculatus]
MWWVGRWAPLLLCLLQSAPGRPRLAPPRNVTLLSQNFTVYLTWLPGLSSPPNVTYFVRYQSFSRPGHWQKVERCAGIKALVCPLMCLKGQDLYNKFKGRVQAAAAGRGRSLPVESGYLDYLSEVELAPPTLVLTLTESMLRVNATYQLPPCMPSVDLKYQVEFWKEGSGNKTLFPDIPHGQPVQIPLQHRAHGHHCLSARTVYTFTVPKYSLFSEPSCIFLKAPGTNWAVLTLPFLLPLLGAAAVAGVIWKKLEGDPWFQWVKTPQALELTIRMRPVPQVRDPDTLQAGPEKDGTEDEDEDTDDSDSIQPYLDQPLFVTKKLQVTGHTEAYESGVDSGGPWTPPDGSEGSSAWDSSDRSWPSTVDSSLTDEVESSSCLDKKEADQEPGRDGHPEPLGGLEFSEDSGTVEELLKDDLSGWRIWDSLPPPKFLVPGEPPVSLQMLTFCWDNNPGEEEGEEEEEEEEVEKEEEEGWESEPKGSSADCWGAPSLQRTEVRGRLLGDYMAR